MGSFIDLLPCRPALRYARLAGRTRLGRGARGVPGGKLGDATAGRATGKAPRRTRRREVALRGSQKLCGPLREGSMHGLGRRHATPRGGARLGLARMQDKLPAQKCTRIRGRIEPQRGHGGGGGLRRDFDAGTRAEAPVRATMAVCSTRRSARREGARKPK